jgi:hypothetical protein
MDYIYSIDLSAYINNKNSNGSGRETGDGKRFGNVCALSNRNILAFSNECYTYMLPLEKPNELVPVNLSNSLCTQLIWSDDGQYLLGSFKNQTVHLYQIKTSLLNSVETVFSFQIAKDDNVLAVKSFSKTPKVTQHH